MVSTGTSSDINPTYFSVYVILLDGMTGNGHIEHLKVTKYNFQPSEAR